MYLSYVRGENQEEEDEEDGEVDPNFDWVKYDKEIRERMALIEKERRAQYLGQKKVESGSSN